MRSFRSRWIFSLLIPFTLLFWENAWAFPEMVRHGYVNCTTCHVSPTGGGLMTSYGRELSRELLSTWGQGEENAAESSFAYGIEKSPDWLLMGGDLRAVQVYRDTQTFRSAKLILMQADLEGGVVSGKWALVGSLGLPGERKKNSSGASEVISRSHYALYHLTDEVSLRAGRFFYSYGIRTPDHMVATKQVLGLQQPGAETYNFESAYLGERWNWIVTGIFGRPDDASLDREKGIAAQGSLSFSDTYKVGLSFLHAETPGSVRNVSGTYGILGFTPKLFLLSEYDIQFDRLANAAVMYHRLDYEAWQGVHGYLTFESSGVDMSHAYGAGVQFFPRSHFELNLSWQLKGYDLSPERENYAWLLFHFYL